MYIVGINVYFPQQTDEGKNEKVTTKYISFAVFMKLSKGFLKFRIQFSNMFLRNFYMLCVIGQHFSNFNIHMNSLGSY